MPTARSKAGAQKTAASKKSASKPIATRSARAQRPRDPALPASLPTRRRPKRFSAKQAATPDAKAPPATEAPPATTSFAFDKDDAYRVMRAMVLSRGLASSQIESFNDFVNVQIPKCLSEHPPVMVLHDGTRYIVEILGVRYDYPSVRESDGENRYVYPHECHLRRLSYTFNMLVTARYTIQDVASGKIKHTVIFRDNVFDRIPCMKMSEFCAATHDPEGAAEDESEVGGYFVSTGAEKVVIGQEAPRNNHPFVFLDANGTTRCELRSFNETRFRSTSTLYLTAQPPFETQSVEERRTAAPRITVRIPFVSDPLALPVPFKLLGVDDPERMLEYICTADDPEWFQRRALESLLHSVDSLVVSHEHAVTRLAHDRGKSYSSKRRKTMRETQNSQETEYDRCKRQVDGLISTEFLPHQGYAQDAVESKTVLLGMCVRKVLRVLYGLQQPDDRDHYQHRRVQMTSSLMTLLFRRHLALWRKRLASSIRHELDNGAQFVKVRFLLHANIGGHLSTALSTGNFSMERGETNSMDGVAQVLSRTEPHAHIAHVNRTANPMNKDGRAVKPRLQHASGIGIIGPWDTPEGPSCGLVRNKALLAGVRVGYPTATLIDAVMSTGMVDPEGKNLPLSRHKSCPVFVSGELIGVCSAPSPDDLLKLLRDRRSVQDLPFDVSIFRTNADTAVVPQGEIHVNGDPGSLWWPLIQIDKMEVLRDTLDHVTNEDELWSALVSQGAIVAVNKDEENELRVALDHRQLREHPPGTYTHVVIHPSQICSLYEAKGPLLEFNQAPRVTYQAAMQKQAVGRTLTNAAYRADTASYSQWYPQRSLVSTFVDELLSSDGVVSLQNPIVALICSNGYNIEDAVILKKSAIEMGLFRATVRRSMRTVVRTRGVDETEELGLPPDGCRSKLKANYTKVNPETGVVEPGTRVEHNDVLVSKYVRVNRKVKVENPISGDLEEITEQHVRDRSVVNRSREAAIVDEVIWSTTLEGEPSIRIRTRAVRVPEVANKYASRFGQKGTCGAIFSEEDMPTNPKTGMTPDMLVNPHGQITRMTLGHMIETKAAKVAAVKGEQIDGTPFSLSEALGDPDNDDAVIEKLGEELRQRGYDPSGEEWLFDGRTGKTFKSKIFIGPIAYMPLKHYVVDKYHARSRGPRDPQTRQPREGRLNDGGHRLGEMERENLVEHGAVQTLHERFTVSSDRTLVPICSVCHEIAQPPKRRAGGALHAATVAADRPYCRVCQRYDTVRMTEMPHAYKLSVQELNGAHIHSGSVIDVEVAAKRRLLEVS